MKSEALHALASLGAIPAALVGVLEAVPDTRGCDVWPYAVASYLLGVLVTRNLRKNPDDNDGGTA